MNRLALLCVLPLWTACTPWVIGEHSPDMPQPSESASAPSPFSTAAVAAPVVAPPEPALAPGAAHGVLTPLALVQPPLPLVETPREVPAWPGLLPLAAPPPRTRRPLPVFSPPALVQESQRGARIGPGEAGYRQVGAMHFYEYQVGGVYDLYVSPNLATGLLFPAGESIKVGLFLPKDDFDVDTKSAGEQAQAYDALTIHPKVEKGTYEAFVLMASGRAYLFHLIVGKQGMLTVSFDLPGLEVQP